MPDGLEKISEPKSHNHYTHKYRQERGSNNVSKHRMPLPANGKSQNNVSHLVTNKIGQEDSEDIRQSFGQNNEFIGQILHENNLLTKGNPSRSNDTASWTFYPAYTHSSSQTYFKWANLTAYEIHHTLQIRDGYTHSWLSAGYRRGRDTPQLLFYLNHPIQFVQVVGVVVNFEEWFEWFWLFTIDDSSGSTVDVICQKPEKKRLGNSEQAGEETNDEKEQQEEIAKLSEQVACKVQIGAVLQVKGTVTLFQRNKPADNLVTFNTNTRSAASAQKQEQPTRQITLQRLTLVDDTNQELNLITARTKLRKEVLSRPWILSQKALEKLHRKALGEVEHGRKRARRHAQKKQKLEEEEQQDAEQILYEYEQEEEERETEAVRIRQAAEELTTKPKRKNEELEAEAAKDTSHPSAHEHNTNCDGRSEPAVQPVQNIFRKDKRKKQTKTASMIGTTYPAGKTSHGSTTAKPSMDTDEKAALLRAAFG